MDTENQIYRDLQKYLDRLPGGYAATESGADIRLLKRFFTPEEARVAIQLSMKPEPLKRIYRRVKKSGMSISIEELQQILDQMLLKATLVPHERGYREKHYSGAGFAMGGIMTLQVDRLTKELMNDHNQYKKDSSAVQTEPKKVSLPLRTIPVEKAIPFPEKYQVSSYDSVRKLVESAPGPIAVANCICRQITELHGGRCTKTDLRETCLILGPDHAKHYVDMGIGRYITKQETFDILDKVQEAGLVLQPENSQRPEAICCCCGDCCVVFKMVKQYPRPADLYISNFYSEVDPKLCTGCEICVERCQPEAMTMVNGVALVNLDRCIGCGNCVAICPVNAVQLKKKEKELVPIKSKEASVMKKLSEKVGKWNMLKIRMKMLLGLKV